MFSMFPKEFHFTLLLTPSSAYHQRLVFFKRNPHKIRDHYHHSSPEAATVVVL